MKILRDIDGDEISLVKRAANRRRFLLMKGDSGMDGLEEFLSVPYAAEGALLDELRKDGVDEDVEQAFVAGVRLLKSIEDDLSPETIEKLGTELYGKKNPPLNSTSADSDEDLDGVADGPDLQGAADGDGELSGSAATGELSGKGSAPKVAADKTTPDDDDDYDYDDDMDKADFSAFDRKNLASSGKALPDGSYPIRNKSDLKNAIQAVGRAKNPGKARAWITRRAKSLGATNMLPDSWGVSKEDSSSEDGPVNDDERGTVGVQVPVKKEDGTWDFSDVPEESRDFFVAMLEKADKADKVEKALEETKEKLAKADETLLNRTMIEKAARLSHVAATDDLAPILKEASQKFDEETFEKLEGMLGTLEERIRKGSLFTEMGRSSLEDGKTADDAYSQLVQKANELIEKSTDLTQEQAFDRAMRENPGLYDRYVSENPAKYDFYGTGG